ncbi:hypothetical protein MHBO_000650 [Bonamia ostreae]|uniref:MI domain-containing protein n=1 Tax=Bonamia ostreae TaxID=126728 RepID=A0ABV2AGE7_9EUKA
MVRDRYERLKNDKGENLKFSNENKNDNLNQIKNAHKKQIFFKQEEIEKLQNDKNKLIKSLNKSQNDIKFNNTNFENFDDEHKIEQEISIKVIKKLQQLKECQKCKIKDYFEQKNIFGRIMICDDAINETMQFICDYIVGHICYCNIVAVASELCGLAKYSYGTQILSFYENKQSNKLIGTILSILMDFSVRKEKDIIEKKFLNFLETVLQNELTAKNIDRILKQLSPFVIDGHFNRIVNNSNDQKIKSLAMQIGSHLMKAFNVL